LVFQRLENSISIINKNVFSLFAIKVLTGFPFAVCLLQKGTGNLARSKLMVARSIRVKKSWALKAVLHLCASGIANSNENMQNTPIQPASRQSVSEQYCTGESFLRNGPRPKERERRE
jgi:hypothetical protein